MEFNGKVSNMLGELQQAVIDEKGALFAILLSGKEKEKRSNAIYGRPDEIIAAIVEGIHTAGADMPMPERMAFLMALSIAMKDVSTYLLKEEGDAPCKQNLS